PFDDRQTQSHAARFCRAERREDLLAHFRRNPMAVVLYRNQHGTGAAAFVNRLGRKGDLRFFLLGDCFGRVRNQMRHRFGQRPFIAKNLWQVGRQFRFHRHAPVHPKFAARKLEPALYRHANIQRFHLQFRWMSESVDLSDDLIEAIDFLNNDLVEIFSELRIIETLGQKLRERLNRDEWITNFVRHTRGQVRPKGGAIDQVLLLPQIYLRGQIVNDGDGSEGSVLVEESTRCDREGTAGILIDLLSRRKIRLRLNSFPQHGGQSSTNGFDRPVECIGGLQPEDRFRRGIKPANDAFFINSDDSRRDRFQERFGQGFLQCDLFVEKGVLENGGNMLGQDHQSFEITVIKG